MPITNSSNNHQFFNAKILHEKSCSIMIEEKNLFIYSFEYLKTVDLEKLKFMKECCKKFKKQSNKENIIDNILINSKWKLD